MNRVLVFTRQYRLGTVIRKKTWRQSFANNFYKSWPIPINFSCRDWNAVIYATWSYLHPALLLIMFLANLCHGEYSKCTPVGRMQAWRRLRHCSMPSSITLCSTPTHTSSRCYRKSFTYCAWLARNDLYNAPVDPSRSSPMHHRLVDSLPHILVLRLGLFNGQKSGSL